MLARDRQAQIMAQLHATTTISAYEAARAFNVSTETIRRDLLQLERSGRVQRVYGGAVLVGGPPAPERPHDARSAINVSPKRDVGVLASHLLTTERTIFIDAGTTAQLLARAISSTFTGTVITPSLLVATELQHATQVRVLLTPGYVQYKEPTVSGSITNEFLNTLHLDLAFISCSGMTEEGVTDFKLDYATLSRSAIARAERSVLLADSSKHGIEADILVCTWESMHAVVTDQVPRPALHEAVISGGAKIVHPVQTERTRATTQPRRQPR